MNESWRLLDLGMIDPYYAQSVKEVLLKAIKKSLIPSTLCLCVRRKFVFLGRRTNLKRRVNLEYCRKDGIPIIRDFIGGDGASVLDGDVLQYNLVSGDPTLNNLTLMKCIIESLRTMGLDSEVRAAAGSNDIVIKNQKISGNIFAKINGFTVFGGSLITDFNYDFCEDALLPSPDKFAGKEAKTHSEWVTTIRTQLGRKITHKEVVSALKEGFETVLQVKFEVANSFTDAELQIIEGLKEKYRSEEWTKYRRWSPVKEYWRPK